MFDDEVVVVNLNSGSYYTLENEAAFIWSLLAHGCTESSLLDQIGHRYGASYSEIEHVVKPFLAELQGEGLVTADFRDGGESTAPQPASQLDPDAVQRTFATPILHKYTDMEELLLIDPIHEVDEMGWPSANPRTHE
ncbi:MAG: PqqD family protein [Chloroflexi bacterium]|nr:PqqD family protein [Chloroflexota bacterium]